MANDAHGSDIQAPAGTREELLDVVDDYVAALVAGDPDAAPLSPDVAFVENQESKTPGEGLWRTASGPPTDFTIYVPDPASGQVGFMGLLEEAGEPVLLGLRLQVEDGRITEAEHLIARDLTPGRDDHNNLANLRSPRYTFLDTVDPAHRNSREELLEITANYYDALAEDDGSLAAFAPNCVRIENGFQTTCKTPPPEPDAAELLRTLDAGEQLDAGAFSNITRVESRRFDVADVETGLVCGLSQLRHPMEETTLDIEGVPGVETVERDFDPFDTVAMHVFKISGGKIRAIEAVGIRAPYESSTGWE